MFIGRASLPYLNSVGCVYHNNDVQWWDIMRFHYSSQPNMAVLLIYRIDLSPLILLHPAVWRTSTLFIFILLGSLVDTKHRTVMKALSAAPKGSFSFNFFPSASHSSCLYCWFSGISVFELNVLFLNTDKNNTVWGKRLYFISYVGVWRGFELSVIMMNILI